MFAGVFIIAPLVFGAMYCAYRAITAAPPDYDGYIERQAQISDLQLRIMQLKIEIEVAKQLDEMIEDLNRPQEFDTICKDTPKK